MKFENFDPIPEQIKPLEEAVKQTFGTSYGREVSDIDNDIEKVEQMIDSNREMYEGMTTVDPVTHQETQTILGQIGMMDMERQENEMLDDLRQERNDTIAMQDSGFDYIPPGLTEQDMIDIQNDLARQQGLVESPSEVVPEQNDTDQVVSEQTNESVGTVTDSAPAAAGSSESVQQSTSDIFQDYYLDMEEREHGVNPFENPSAAVFGRDGGDLPEGVSATAYEKNEEGGYTTRRLDLDGDGIYETEEVIAEYQEEVSSSDTGSFHVTHNRIMHSVMYRMDTDGDGVVDREEEVRINGPYNPTLAKELPADVSERIVRADADGDGTMDVSQTFRPDSDYHGGLRERDMTAAEASIFDADTGEWREINQVPTTRAELEQMQADQQFIAETLGLEIPENAPAAAEAQETDGTAVEEAADGSASADVSDEVVEIDEGISDKVDEFSERAAEILGVPDLADEIAEAIRNVIGDIDSASEPAEATEPAELIDAEETETVEEDVEEDETAEAEEVIEAEETVEAEEITEAEEVVEAEEPAEAEEAAETEEIASEDDIKEMDEKESEETLGESLAAEDITAAEDVQEAEESDELTEAIDEISALIAEYTSADGVDAEQIADMIRDKVNDVINSAASEAQDTGTPDINVNGRDIVLENKNEADFDRDGESDMTSGYFSLDDNGDGIDERYYIELTDTDSDGAVDLLTVMTDYENDGHFDLLEQYEVDPATGETVLDGSADISDENRGTFNFELDNFSPEHAGDEGIVGNPENSIDHWEFQGDTNRCAVCAQMFVIEEFTGSELDIDEVSAFAAENGWFDEQGGTSPANCGKLLEAFGVPSQTVMDASVSDIESALDNGQKVIVGVDSGEYWMGESDELYMPVDGADHAVEVIGIDRSDAENPKVILNDSGIPNGKGVEVPLDVFEDAWQDSDCFAVIAG